MDEAYKRLSDFAESENECKCLDGTFEEFNKCCGKTHNIQNPIEILFSHVEKIAKESKVKRLRDMTPEEATKTLKRIFEVTEGKK